ncbi:MAG: RodZ domain-containing protein [Pseudomonadota bacterium]
MADNDDAAAETRRIDDPSPGERLKKARTKQKRSLDDISKELHLDRWMLEAIERDDYNSLGAPVFAKGHLRQYAKVLNIEPDDLMVGYYQVCGTREQPPLVADSMLHAPSHHERSWNWVVPAVIALVAIAVVAGGIYWYMQPTEAPASVGASSEELNLAASTSLVPAIEPVAQAAQPVLDETVEPVNALLIPPEQAQPRDVPDPERPVIEDQNMTVTLRFTDDSWVEIYDGKRQKLLYGLVESASVKYLNGPPPISVFLGRQSAVNVEVDGENFPIPVTATRGNTARFQIDKP